MICAPKQQEDQIKQARMLLKSVVERAEEADDEDGTKGGKEKTAKRKPKTRTQHPSFFGRTSCFFVV